MEASLTSGFASGCLFRFLLISPPWTFLVVACACPCPPPPYYPLARQLKPDVCVRKKNMWKHSPSVRSSARSCARDNLAPPSRYGTSYTWVVRLCVWVCARICQRASLGSEEDACGDCSISRAPRSRFLVSLLETHIALWRAAFVLEISKNSCI